MRVSGRLTAARSDCSPSAMIGPWVTNADRSEGRLLKIAVGQKELASTSGDTVHPDVHIGHRAAKARFVAVAIDRRDNARALDIHLRLAEAARWAWARFASAIVRCMPLALRLAPFRKVEVFHCRSAPRPPADAARMLELPEHSEHYCRSHLFARGLISLRGSAVELNTRALRWPESSCALLALICACWTPICASMLSMLAMRLLHRGPRPDWRRSCSYVRINRHQEIMPLRGILIVGDWQLDDAPLQLPGHGYGSHVGPHGGVARPRPSRMYTPHAAAPESAPADAQRRQGDRESTNMDATPCGGRRILVWAIRRRRHRSPCCTLRRGIDDGHDEPRHDGDQDRGQRENDNVDGKHEAGDSDARYIVKSSRSGWRCGLALIVTSQAATIVMEIGAT